MAISLSNATLADLPEPVPGPGYERSSVTPGIVHFGVGGFHRAHQAMYLDKLFETGGALDWGIIGVGTLPGDQRMGEALTAQDMLYTLVLKHADGRLEPRVIGSLVDYLYAPHDPEGLLARMSDAQIRVVSLTITEGGYSVDQNTGEFDPDEALQSDIAREGAPSTPFGFITEALRRRRDAGTPPFTVMSCDNLPDNGHVAHDMICAFAERQDPDLAAWIEREVPFPNSMVDRITPVTTDEDRGRVRDELGIDDRWPVVCEPFAQWVLEDHFVAGRPPLEEAGVQIVDDVAPYEGMKLRMLNAGHQALGYLGRLAGFTYAHEAAADPAFRRFLDAYMEREAIPTLQEVPGVDLTDYRRTLLERFANPEVRDTLERLCMETSDRIPKFLLPVIRDNLARGGEIQLSALVVAAWARYAEGTDEEGKEIEVVDRFRDQVMSAAAAQSDDPLAFLKQRTFFGDLVDDQRFTDAYTRHLSRLHEVGARAVVEEVS